MILLELQTIILKDKHARLVFVGAAIVWRREDCDHVGERVLRAPLVHVEAFLLDLVPAENRQHLVLSQQLFHRLLAEVVRAVAFGVLFEVSVHSFLVLHGVRPQKVAENAVQRDFSESVDLVDLLQLVQLR